MITKKTAQILHATKRANERAGIDLTPALRNKLIAGIQKRRFKFLWRQSGRVTVWRVYLAGRKFLAIYDSHRHTLVTFLYPRRPKEKDFHYVTFDPKRNG